MALLTTTTRTLQVGDMIVYRPGFGMFPPRRAKVVGIELTDHRRSKHGTPVDTVAWHVVEDNRALISVDTQNWLYAEQVDLAATAKLIDARRADGEKSVLSPKWCTCPDNGYPSLEGPEWIYAADGACTCGITKHHYHCPDCGRVKQVG